LVDSGSTVPAPVVVVMFAFTTTGLPVFG